MKRASQQITASFDDLRRAMEEINAKQEALHQAEAELVKMRIETLANKTQIEAIRKAIEDLSAKSASLRGLQPDV